MKVYFDEYGRIVVEANEQEQADLKRRIANTEPVPDPKQPHYPLGAPTRYVDGSDSLRKINRDWTKKLLDYINEELNLPGIIQVTPEEVGALTGEDDTLIADIGEAIHTLPDDLWEKNESWGFTQLNDKYVLRTWQDAGYQIRGWYEHLADEGEFIFTLGYDKAYEEHIDWFQADKDDIISFQWRDEGMKLARVNYVSWDGGKTMDAVEILAEDTDRKPERYYFNTFYMKDLKMVKRAKNGRKKKS